MFMMRMKNYILFKESESGRSKAESAESVSFSLKAGTTMEDADKIVDSLKEIVTGERTVL